jgi:hypothetical protein
VHQARRTRHEAVALRIANSCLHELAETIPSQGGTKIGAILREAARNAPSNTAIVECGCWLGAGTAQLALGIREREDMLNVQLHTYDRWQADKSEVEKAAMRGWHLSVGEDTLPRVRQTLSEFRVPIQFHRAELMEAVWADGPISVFVDDACKTPLLFCQAIETFAPHWIPGQTIIVLMDFNFWKKTGLAKHECQKRFVERFGYAFERINSRVAAFRYIKQTDFMPWLNATKRAPSARFERAMYHIAKVARRSKAGLNNWIGQSAAPRPSSVVHL